jgi:hypothetical protein
MSVTAIFAEPCLARFLAARVLSALTGLKWTTASFAIRFLAFAFAVAVTATTRAIYRFIIHNSSISVLFSPH